jgi:phenylpropionate dioxygenase-like ring-hydroxylating dioxygenase large terminal subunit
MALLSDTALLPERLGPPTADPRPAFPNGWQSIGFSEEVATGQVISRHMLGRDLVLFRGANGVLSVVDAYCPHLGAHLGCGGTVVDNNLRCPYHHWQFDGSGACASIPYGTNIPASAMLKSYPCQEINGFIFIWYHAQDAAPHWHIPAHPIVENPDYYFVEQRAHLFRGHPQDLSENGADFTHFVAIHGWDGVKLKFVPDGHSYKVGYDTDGVDTGYGEAGAVDVDSLTVGPGYTYTHYTGVNDWLMMSSFTPVTAGQLYLHSIYYAHRSHAKHQVRTLIEAVDTEWRKDIAIWEGKTYREKPALNNGDGPIALFRRWYQQFYS